MLRYYEIVSRAIFNIICRIIPVKLFRYEISRHDVVTRFE
jgi:hypothetical protein